MLRSRISILIFSFGCSTTPLLYLFNLKTSLHPLSPSFPPYIPRSEGEFSRQSSLMITASAADGGMGSTRLLVTVRRMHNSYTQNDMPACALEGAHTPFMRFCRAKYPCQLVGDRPQHLYESLCFRVSHDDTQYPNRKIPGRSTQYDDTAIPKSVGDESLGPF